MIALFHSLAVLALLSAPPAEPDEAAPSEAAPPASAQVLEPSAEPPAPTLAPSGGFGSVQSVTTDSNVHAPPPTELTPAQGEHAAEPGIEMSARAEAGYAQTNLGNAEGLDHQGMFLRLHFVLFPWVTRQRRVAGGLGLLYSYAGINRNKLPAGVTLAGSGAQQQEVMLSVDLLLRPHPAWFSIQPSGTIGLGFYSNAQVYAADRPATIDKKEYAFVAGGALALCTAWDIACVIGGSEILLDVQTLPIDTTVVEAPVIDPWGWHVGVGVDILRVLARANLMPS